MVTQEQLSSVVLLPFPRFNSILVAAPRWRFEEVEKQIKQLDVKPSPETKATAFPLSKVPASRVGQLITNFYQSRYPNDVNQVRVTWDDASNTVFVQAAPGDLAEIRDLIERIDSTVSSAVNDIRLVPLRNGLADDVANLILRAVAQGVQPTAGAGIAPTAGGFGGTGGIPGTGGLGLGGLGASARPPGAGALPGAAGFAGAGLGGGTLSTKFTTLRFISAQIKGRVAEAGFLEDIRLTADPRTNMIIVSAPAKAMDLLLALIQELDVPPAARAEINIFPLKKSDASYMANTIQQLFLGSSSLQQSGGGGLPAAGGLPAPGGLPGLGGGPGAFPGTTGLLGAGTPRPLSLTIAGVTPEGAPLIDLRLTVDQRTNTLIVAGSRSDLEVIEAIITRLEDAPVQERHNEVYRLVNSTAVDVANALNNFITGLLGVYSRAPS